MNDLGLTNCHSGLSISIPEFVLWPCFSMALSQLIVQSRNYPLSVVLVCFTGRWNRGSPRSPLRFFRFKGFVIIPRLLHSTILPWRPGRIVWPYCLQSMNYFYCRAGNAFDKKIYCVKHKLVSILRPQILTYRVIQLAGYRRHCPSWWRNN